ncbi:MAG: AraC family transcriptional regulator [Bacteroidota bacterium]
MKPVFEKIEPASGSSFSIKKFVEHGICGTPNWQYHPEYEIVYISNGKGKRHIGDHISYYEDGDLIFLGPDLPHFGFTNEISEEHFEVFIQLKKDFLGNQFLSQPEMWHIKQLLRRSQSGISFFGQTKAEVADLIIEMVNSEGFDRLIKLLEILNVLASTSEYKILNASGLTVKIKPHEQRRMDVIYRYVQENFTRPLALDDVAGLVNMTVPAFCRYFKKLTNLTFTRFVNEFRIAHACQLLLKGELTIAETAFESGFNNLSHFNKQFRLITDQSPRDFRKSATGHT